MAVAHKSAISVGLICVPVSLYKTTRDISVNFNQLCKDSHERVKYKKYCPSCDKEVTSDDIIKGYEFEKGRYVTITNDELEKIKTKKDKTIHILHFAKMSDIDQIYYDRNYYVVAEPGGEQAYELLRQAMLSQKKVAIAKTVMSTNEELIVLYPTKEGILAKMLYYQEEIQSIPVPTTKTSVDKQQLEMAKTLVDSMTQPFDAAAYHDEYQERLRQAIEKKIAGQEIVAIDTSKPSNIINLMEALQKSVELSQNHKLSGTA